MATILCVDDEPTVLATFRRALERNEHRVIAVNNAEAALTVLGRGGIDLVLSDSQMPGTSGLDFMSRLREDGYDVPVIMVTGHGSIEHAVSAMKAGAVDYITKPVEVQQLEVAVDQALELSRLRRENETLKEEVRQLRGQRSIVGDSRALQELLDVVRTVAPARSTVLIQGESGTGKELIARALHGWSDRADAPFISVNCAALPENLIESSLFGHEKGAFTGATRRVKGAFERADGGTLLLDEVTEMRPDLQAKLLRVLQEQEFERVGGTSRIRVDVRVVATTNRDIREAVRDGTFREDLYYRLAVVPITVPPLRDRRDDIPALAQRFARRAGEDVGRPVEGLTPAAVERLVAYDWPGNVRELAHAVERAVLLGKGPLLGPEAFDLPSAIDATAAGVPGRRQAPADSEPPGFAAADSAASGAKGPRPGDGRVLLDTLEIAKAEAALIARALEETGQNRTRAAELLGISVRTLRNKLNRPD